MDRRGACRWKAPVRIGGNAVLNAQLAPGRLQLAAQDRRKLAGRLRKQPVTAGFGMDLGSCPRLASASSRAWQSGIAIASLEDFCTTWAGACKSRSDARWNTTRGKSAPASPTAGHRTKGARRPGAAIVFVDESKLRMGPVARGEWTLRTWLRCANSAVASESAYR
jgi:hypothetical protein